MATHSLSGGSNPSPALGDTTLTVSLACINGEEFVDTDIDTVCMGFQLTAEEARAYAADLIAHADALDERRARVGS